MQLFTALEVECPRDIFKQQELVHLKVTFIVPAVSSWLADIQVLSKKETWKILSHRILSNSQQKKKGL